MARKPIQTRYKVNSDTGCWEWLLAKAQNGYGRVRVGGVQKAAHRVEYEKIHGTIPDGLEIDHLCRNKGCVNPSHLEAVSHRENEYRKSTTILNRESVREMRRLYEQGEKQTVIAQMYGVSQGHISNVIRGKQWATTHAYG